MIYQNTCHNSFINVRNTVNVCFLFDNNNNKIKYKNL